MKTIYNRLLWLLEWAQFRPLTLNRKRWANVRSAKNTVELCRELGLQPRCLFDVGANEGQWAYWLKKAWPGLRVESFEPNINVPTPPPVHRMALSQFDGRCHLIGTDTTGQVVEASDGLIHIRRFETYWHKEITGPAVLKVDAETKSADALIGFGCKINKFAVVVVECCWDNSRCPALHGQAVRIFKFMFENGFSQFSLLDDGKYSGRSDYADIAFWKPAPDKCKK